MLIRAIASVVCILSAPILFAQPVVEYSMGIRQECCGGKILAAGKVGYTGSGFCSEIGLFENVDSHEKMLWKSNTKDAIGLSVIDGSRVDNGLACVALVFQKRGSMAVDLDVVGFENGKVVSLYDGVASSYEVIRLNGVNLLVAHGDINVVDVPIIYHLTKSEIVDVSLACAKYYKSLFDAMPYTIKNVPLGFEAAYVKLCMFAGVIDAIKCEVVRLQGSQEAESNTTTNFRALMNEINKYH